MHNLLHMFLSKSFFNIFVATTARRDVETEDETEARRAQDSRGTYVLFKCLYNQTYCIYYNTMC